MPKCVNDDASGVYAPAKDETAPSYIKEHEAG